MHRKNHFPHPAGHRTADTSRDVTGLSAHLGPFSRCTLQPTPTHPAGVGEFINGRLNPLIHGLGLLKVCTKQVLLLPFNPRCRQVFPAQLPGRPAPPRCRAAGPRSGAGEGPCPGLPRAPGRLPGGSGAVRRLWAPSGRRGAARGLCPPALPPHSSGRVGRGHPRLGQSPLCENTPWPCFLSTWGWLGGPGRKEIENKS